MRKSMFRAKAVQEDVWIYGNFYEVTKNKREKSEKNTILTQDCGVYIYSPKIEHVFMVKKETLGEYACINDEDGDMIFEGDILEVFGMRGKVVQELGAFGLYFPEGIDYELLESKVPFNNKPCFCYNDNFISLWELWWNYEQDDNPLYCAKIIGNEFDNPELL